MGRPPRAQAAHPQGAGWPAVAVARITSDHADNGAPKDFKKFCEKVSSLMGLGIASYFMKAIVR